MYLDHGEWPNAKSLESMWLPRAHPSMSPVAKSDNSLNKGR
jgi:hypothetical protein